MPYHRYSPSLSILAALALLGLVGCGGSGDELPREAVSGAVTFDGKPLASGRISFQPTGAEAITQGGGIIQDGEYSIDQEQGLVPGTYQVRIFSSGGAEAEQLEGEDEAPGMPPRLPKEIIPAQYNTNSTLSAEVGGRHESWWNLCTQRDNRR